MREQCVLFSWHEIETFCEITMSNDNNNKNNKKHFHSNERRCRDVKTQKACEQGWEVNAEPKFKQTTSI